MNQPGTDGSVHRILDSGGCKVGIGEQFHSSWRDSLILSRSWNLWGTGTSMDHRLRSSAMTLSFTGIWVTSNSTPVIDASFVRISTKIHKGCEVVNNLLLTLSAPMLSLRDFKQIGMRKPGYAVAISHTRAICARVSNAEILRCMFSSRWIDSSVKSSCENFSENHSWDPETCWMNPPIWQKEPDAQASAAAVPAQYGGETHLSQASKRCKIRIESCLSLRLDEPGSMIRNQMRFSVLIWMDLRSSKLETGWCRTEISLLRTGIADPNGWEWKIKSWVK